MIRRTQTLVPNNYNTDISEEPRVALSINVLGKGLIGSVSWSKKATYAIVSRTLSKAHVQRNL